VVSWTRKGLLLVLLFLAAGCTKQSIDEKDLPLLLTAGELVEYGIPVDSTEQFESFGRTRYFDGSVDVDYEFETPGDAADPLYMAVTVTFERTVRDAKASYLAERGASLVVGRIGGMETEALPGFFDYGDDSYFVLLKGEQGPVGNVFGTRVGKKVYFVLLAGAYFDDPEQWSDWVMPKLRYMEAYNPQA